MYSVCTLYVHDVFMNNERYVLHKPFLEQCLEGSAAGQPSTKAPLFPADKWNVWPKGASVRASCICENPPSRSAPENTRGPETHLSFCLPSSTTDSSPRAFDISPLSRPTSCLFHCRLSIALRGYRLLSQEYPKPAHAIPAPFQNERKFPLASTHTA